MTSDNNCEFSHVRNSHRYHGRRMLAAGLILGLLFLHSWAYGQTEWQKVYIEETPLKVEIANNKTTRSHGLMHRKILAPNTGMLFVFDEPDTLRFWMKDTPLDLDIGFFDEKRRLIQIEQMKSYDDATIHTSRAPAVYALEVNRGWFSENRIKPGALLRLGDDTNKGLK